MIETYCGLHCSTCTFKDSTGCGGCIETGGQPFHGECPVALCCIEKQVPHCGACDGFPCVLLMQYSCDIEHGDKPIGERIRQCVQWAKLNKA